MLSILLPLATALLMSTPYKNGVVGIQMELPSESIVVGTSSHPPYCLISSDNPSNAWSLRVDRQPNWNGALPKDIVHDSIQEIEAPEGTVTLFDTEIAIGDQKGWWNVLHHTKQDQQSIIGRLALPAQGDQVIFVTLITDMSGWKYGREAFIGALETIIPLDPVALLSKKLQSLQSAESFLDNLSEKTLRPLVGFQEWRRIQSEGAKDIGYAFVKIGLGSMQDLEQSSSAASATDPTGIIVTFQSRFVPNLETGVVTDTDARYWMSWDGKDERWTSKTTRWLDKISATNSETGIRNRAQLGAPKPKLLVIQQDLTTNVIEPPFEILITDPWLPRALVWITGPLFASLDSSETFRWRCYDNVDNQEVILRIDELTVRDNETKTLVSKFGEGGIATVTTFDLHGNTTKQIHPNKMVVTSCTKESIDSIWEPLNLW